MPNSSIALNVSAHVGVSDETAKRCLRLLEMWQEDNPDKYIQATKSGYRIVYEIKETEKVGSK